jgi:hypothetical protein
MNTNRILFALCSLVLISCGAEEPEKTKTVYVPYSSGGSSTTKYVECRYSPACKSACDARTCNQGGVIAYPSCAEIKESCYSAKTLAP